MIPEMKLTILVNLLLLTLSLGAVERINTSGHVRIKRQDGYVYKRPSVAFELPTRPPVFTQPPTVDRTRSQQMYYAYPAPTAGGTVNIGYSTPGSTSTTASGGYSSGGYTSGSNAQATGGYGSTSAGYGSSTTLQGSIGAGYNYGSPSTSQASSTAQSQATNAVTQASTAGTVSTTAEMIVSRGDVSSQATGYSYGTPSTAAPSVTQSESTVASTNAPKYLPPLSNDGSSTVGGSTSVVSTSPTSTQGSTVATPSDSYLPPVSGLLGSGQSGISTSAVTPSTAYLPPNSSSTSLSYGTPSTAGASSPTPQTPTAAYLPPNLSNGATQGTVATPAITYLPPVFK